MTTKTLPLQTSDHKAVYKEIRNFLAGRFLGATRDESILEEFLKCLFCKLYILRNDLSPLDSGTKAITKLYRETFSQIKEDFPELFTGEDEILLDPGSIAYVDEQLDRVDLLNSVRDPVGDAYELFIGSAVRGPEGQFFTPRNAVNLLVSIVDPKPGEHIIDPACGAGSFLNEAARHLLSKSQKAHDVIPNITGIDKDAYLVKLARLRLASIDGHAPDIYRADSLAWENGEDDFPLYDKLGTFDVVLTNPPFGSKIVAASPEIQSNFSLGYKWKKDRSTDSLYQITELQKRCPPQVLFVERCLSLVKPGGRIGMVVPESLITSKAYRYVVQFIRQHAHINAVIGMPEPLFKTSGKGGTHTKTCLLYFTKREDTNKQNQTIFMAEAKWCGHDSRGKPIEFDDLPTIASKYDEWKRTEALDDSHLGYTISPTELQNGILAPRYYNPEIAKRLEELRSTHQLVTMGDLIDEGIVEVDTGDEVGKLAYGTGPIPFVRTSDISNWEIKVDPKHCVSEDIYESLKDQQDVRPGDILMVRDGTYLIGTCALITESTQKIVYQSHIYKLRVKENSLGITPHMLIAVLSSPIVKKQIVSKRLTQDIIDSLGNRINELILPIPRERDRLEEISDKVERAVFLKNEARELSNSACELVEED